MQPKNSCLAHSFMLHTSSHATPHQPPKYQNVPSKNGYRLRKKVNESTYLYSQYIQGLDSKKAAGC
mgnify:FL=1